MRGDRTSRSAAIAGAGAPTRPPTPAPRAPLRERRGRPEPGPPSGVELLAEAFALALPPIPVTLRARQLLAQTSDLFLLPLEQIVTFGPGRLCALIGHTRFMAASQQKYKYKIVDLAESPPKRRRLLYRYESYDLATRIVLKQKIDVAIECLVDIAYSTDAFEQRFPRHELVVFDLDSKQAARLQ